MTIKFPWVADITEANQLLARIAQDLNALNEAANEFADEYDACDSYDTFIKDWVGPNRTFRLTPRALEYKVVISYVVKVRAQTSDQADTLGAKIADRLTATNVSGDWEHEETFVDSVEEE